MEVNIDLKLEDIPGRPLRRIQCNLCDEYVQDKREVYRGKKILCKPCAGGGYYAISSCPYEFEISGLDMIA